MWSLTGVRQNKMNMKARTHFHMLFRDFWVRLIPFPHGKTAHTEIFLGYFCSPTNRYICLRGYRNTKLHFEFLGQNTTIRRLYQELDILCRQQCHCALWQSSLLAAPSSLWPRRGLSDKISSFSSCHFTCLLKHPRPRSYLRSFWVAFSHFSAVPQNPVYWLPALRHLTKWWMQIYGRCCVMGPETTEAETCEWIKLWGS